MTRPRIALLFPVTARNAPYLANAKNPRLLSMETAEYNAFADSSDWSQLVGPQRWILPAELELGFGAERCTVVLYEVTAHSLGELGTRRRLLVGDGIPRHWREWVEVVSARPFVPSKEK